MTLSSIALSPPAPAIVVGTTQQFTATGTYSDGSTRVLTTGVTWASSSTATATVGATGLATGLAPGTSTIPVTSGSITGGTVLTVQPLPLGVATTTLPGGTQYVAYVATLAASGGRMPYSWSIAAGTLPAGLVLSGSTGAITGTPSNSGTFPFTIQVSDSGLQTATRAVSIAVAPAPALAITTSSLASGTQAVAYSASVAGTGGVPPYAWSVATGLPPGLSINPSTGAITGKPTTPGSYAFTVQLTDSVPQSVTTSLTITVSAPPALSITNAALASGTQYTAYSASLVASGGIAPLAWSIAAGLPPGLTLNTATGAITGTPGAPGAYAFTAQVTDAASQVTTKALSITVAAAPALAITNTALPGGTAGGPYSSTLTATGGLPPYTWSILAGLPPALTLNAATGVISGNTTAAGAYSFTVQVLDTASNTASATLTINVVPPGSYTLWPSATVPGTVDDGPDSSVELGVKFKADQAGYIAGIRFYKAAANTGTHVANLWSSTGTKLATATFTGETASGWQQANFATPVAVTANTVYVASYHASVGHYSADLNYFDSSGWDNLPLHALANGVSGGNGVYVYGATSAFPNQTYRGANYWVDVVFNPSAPVPTLTSIAVSPATVTLSAPATQQFTAVASYADGTTVDITREAAWSVFNSNVASVTPAGLASPLNAGTTAVTATFGGVSGNGSLTVPAPAPPPNEGPGGPILVVSGSANAFSRYLAEIVRAEGFQEFLATDISYVTASMLAAYDLVILGDVPLTAAQVSMFTTWVNGGGNLIAMHPDKQLAGLLGLSDAGATLSNAYLLVDTTTAAGAGIVGQTIQFHGSADLYNLSGAQALGTLYSTATASSGKPSVTLRAAGLGQAAAFTYDLARSVVYTRQGNPAWSGQQRDGLSPTRSDDLFYGAAAFDPQPDWIDLGKVSIPQADEQQRLLANLIIQMNLGKRPLPRFWYLPSGFKAAVVMTGDDHSSGGTAGRWDSFIQASPSGCSVADWKCVRGTSYVYAVSPLTNTQAVSYTNQGFEVALHPTTNCGDYVSYSDLNSYYTSQGATFATRYPGVPTPTTSRTHCIVWSDFDTQPQVELARGIRLDTNYYFYPPGWVKDRPGFFTGSGWPMRFADRTGRTIDVYQAATQMTDESDQTYPKTIDALLDGAIGPQGFYGVFTANMHTDQVTSTDSDAIVASALARGVPIVTAKQMLQWLDGRNSSSFGSVSWNGTLLSFTVTAATGARNLRAMVPAQADGLGVSGITQGGMAITYSTETIKGVSYAIFPAVSATYQVTYR